MTNYPRSRDVNERSVFMFVKVRSIWTSNRTKKINERTERLAFFKRFARKNYELTIGSVDKVFKGPKKLCVNDQNPLKMLSSSKIVWICGRIVP